MRSVANRRGDPARAGTHVRAALLCCIAATLLCAPAAAQIDIRSFHPRSPITLVGDARLTSAGVSLTGPAGIGAVWHQARQSLRTGFFSLFRFRISYPGGNRDANGYHGGDGIALVIQDDSPVAIGGWGGEIGYGGIERSVAVEFDTYLNDFPEPGGDDPTSNHVSVQTRGSLPNGGSHAWSRAATSNLLDLTDGEVHTALIEWRGGILSIHIDDCAAPLLRVPIDLREALGARLDDVWIGFTAATGVAWQVHELLAWRHMPLPETPAPVTLCEGESIELRAPDGFDWYRWSTGETATAITATEPETYRVTMGVLGMCEYETTLEFVVRRRGRSSPWIGGRTYICPGDTTELDAGPGWVSYRWSNGATTRTARFAAPEVVFVDVVDSAGCILRSNTVQIGLRRVVRPTIVTSRPLPICAGETVTLDAGAGYVGYRWSTGDSSRAIVVGDSGAYRVSVIDSAGCRSASDTIVVGLAPAPALRLERHAILLCRGDSARLAASGASTYSWKPSTGLSCVDCATPIAGPTATTRYVVTGRSVNGCAVEESVLVTVAEPADTDAGADTTICAGTSARLRGRGGATYRWSPSSALSCDDCPEPIATPSATTLYRLVVNEGSDCSGSDSVLVSVLDPPAVDAGADVAICADGSASLEASGGVAWRWRPTQGLSCDDCRDPIARPAATTVYHLTALGPEGCCASDSVRVVVHETPLADAGADVDICVGESVRLQAAGGVRYEWSPREGLSCDDCAEPIASPVRSTRYVVTVVDTNGCTAVDEVDVRVRDRARLDGRISRELRVAPGDSVRTPIELLDASGWPLSQLDVTITIDDRVARIGQIETSGTRLEGALVETLAESASARRLRFRNVGQRSSDTLLLVTIAGYLGAVDVTPIEAAIDLPLEACTEIRVDSGLLRVDSLCGLSTRLLEMIPGTLALRQTRPNPVATTTQIELEIPTDDLARLSLIDASGREVAIFLERPLPAGLHTLTLDAGDLQSGVYLLRLSVGSSQPSRDRTNRHVDMNAVTRTIVVVR